MYTHNVDLLDYTLSHTVGLHTHIMSCRVTLHQRECVVATREGTTVGMASGCAKTSQQWEARQEAQWKWQWPGHYRRTCSKLLGFWRSFQANTDNKMEGWMGHSSDSSCHLVKQSMSAGRALSEGTWDGNLVRINVQVYCIMERLSLCSGSVSLGRECRLNQNRSHSITGKLVVTHREEKHFTYLGAQQFHTQWVLFYHNEKYIHTTVPS